MDRTANLPTATRETPPEGVLNAIATAVGPRGVIAGEDGAPFLTEWRSRWPGQAALIVAPASTDEVSQVVRICAENNVAVTPQGGNTGLVGGQIPFGHEILLSTKRMRSIRAIDPLNNSMIVDAGVTLAEAQEAAAENDRFFPLSIGSEGSCQLGGVISTNAGGVNVLRYGNMRDLVLGLEVVTPSGDIWNGLKSLRKDNTGLDLKQLFIGGEGVLGVVTGAVIKLYPTPAQSVTALMGVNSAENAVALLSHAQAQTAGAATSFEFMARNCIDIVVKHIPDTRDPLAAAYPFYVLMEFSGAAGAALEPMVEKMLADALEKGLGQDAVIAANETQRASLWKIRHSISEALNGEGVGARFDVSVATSDIPAFLEVADRAVKDAEPNARIVPFGHIGDGNVHYDLVPAEGLDRAVLDASREALEEAVYDVIEQFDGSYSAEHGVGRLRRDTIAKRKSPVEIEMMRAVKAALDPKGIMNPGKML
ncbi:MAG: FAD-binding oxidoreductase [Pseudomonadota bacterium]